MTGTGSAPGIPAGHGATNTISGLGSDGSPSAFPYPKERREGAESYT
jgi:hypothetical protein